MSGLLNARGEPYPEQSSDFCLGCGSAARDHETIAGFGGHVKVICTKCGREITHEQAVREVSE